MNPKIDEKHQGSVGFLERMLLGYPSDLLLSSFVGFSHIKHHRQIGSIVDSLSRVPNKKSLVIAKAIRYAIKTSDMMFEAYSFIENISQDAPMEIYLDLKMINDDFKNEDTYKQGMQPLAVALYAFCKEPDNFARCIEVCKAGHFKLDCDALSVQRSKNRVSYDIIHFNV